MTEIDPFTAKWYVAGAPWLPSNVTPYVLAGSDDPHVGLFVVDLPDPEEWSDFCEQEPYDIAEMAQHLVGLHNRSLESGRTLELVRHVERYFERLADNEIPAKDKPPAECRGLLAACLNELRRVSAQTRQEKI